MDLLQHLAVELTQLVFESAVDQFLCSHRTWVLSLRSTSHAVYDWVHPLIFADLIVTYNTEKRFVRLVDSAEPEFFASTRSVHLLLDADAREFVDLSRHPKLASSLAHVRRWYGPLSIIVQLASASRELGVTGDCWAYTPLSQIVRTLQTVSHLRLVATMPFAETCFVGAVVPQYVVLDAIAEPHLLENVRAVLALRTVRRVVVLLHANPRAHPEWPASGSDRLSVLEDARLHVVVCGPGEAVATPGQLFRMYRDDAERHIVHWDEVGIQMNSQ